MELSNKIDHLNCPMAFHLNLQITGFDKFHTDFIRHLSVSSRGEKLTVQWNLV